ncbi:MULTISPECIES: phenylalanine--tRNA ligase subunit beta [unclassified Haladaptatus]|uniref:phenylalanine--tRNA ligase subunit beta n=1 Tax=unclassified Haladaptatus TaxID=2622732 RepID=UPI00209C3E98|nr:MULTISPECIES: phenylalanine--tRNA ligase subunit beta [unclassified Haladaptatus]MCO8242428.1 phenylalanine--tRNA ligase subunit beta [Haladaptatus sp. AB643]MCO8252186.1 phenylalanine--tRNA ligase subunit beta [Haladaptatus sp. AB618]
MPTVDVNPDELRQLTGHDEKSDDELKEDMFGLGLEYEGDTEDGDMQLEFAPDRLDRLSIEGVARSLRYQYGDDSGVYVPKLNDADWTIEVDESVPEERPYVTGAIVRGVNLSEDALDSLIQLQEKLHATMGRKRAKGAIGIHDLTMLKGSSATEEGGNSIRYVGVDPDGDRFVPLDADAEMTPDEVLRAHPTGEKYADLVSEYDRYPAIYDDIGLFSFPPVINGRRTEVEADSRNLFVELTGTDQWTIDKMCAIICYALDARGGTIEEVEVEYDDRTLVRPNFDVTTKEVTHDRIETLLGIEFTPDEVLDLLAHSGLSGEAEETDDGGVVYEVEIPPYRVDVLHPVDIVDDIGRAYGFNDLSPRYPDVGTVGGRHERSQLEDAAREVLVGLGFEDLLNFHMISEEENFERMRVEPSTDVVGGGTPATIKNPYSEDYTMLRTWALPSLMMVLENNTHRTYPQDLTEIGLAAAVDDSENTGVAEHRTVAGVLARYDASYEDAKARLQAIARNFDVTLETPPTEHPSFISGRAAAVVIDGETVGIVGEIHPEVLVEHDLEVPVTGFEFRLDALE